MQAFPSWAWGAFNEPELLTLKGHTDLIYSVAFSPNGRLIATASGDRTVPVEIRPNEKAR
jgi:WD40 repeat protein